MIQQATFQFLKSLKKNNDRSWVEKHRPAYDAAKTDFLQLAKQLIEGTAQFDPAIAGSNLDEKRVVSRLNRDVRFSKDKSPYKANFFAAISKGGKKSIYAAYYMHLEPGKSFAGGGVYLPMPPELQKIRQEIDYGFKDLQQIILKKTFATAFPRGITDAEALKRVPKGFDESNPAIELLKNKSFYTYTLIPDEDLVAKTGVKTILHYFKTIKPLLDFLNQALD